MAPSLPLTLLPHLEHHIGPDLCLSKGGDGVLRHTQRRTQRVGNRGQQLQQLLTVGLSQALQALQGGLEPAAAQHAVGLGLCVCRYRNWDAKPACKWRPLGEGSICRCCNVPGKTLLLLNLDLLRVNRIVFRAFV